MAWWGSNWQCVSAVNHISHTLSFATFATFLSTSFLFPTMASSSDPFRTPQSTPAFESGYIRVSD